MRVAIPKISNRCLVSPTTGRDGLVGAVVKSAAAFFAHVECQLAVAQMFLAGRRIQPQDAGCVVCTFFRLAVLVWRACPSWF